MRLPVLPPLAPMLSKPSDRLPQDEGWLFEPKWDGFRTLVFRDRDEVLLQSRDERPMNRARPAPRVPARVLTRGLRGILRAERIEKDARARSHGRKKAMKRAMSRWIPLAVFLIAGSVSAARAELYVGASAMTTDAEFSNAGQDFDSSEFSWKLYGGFSFLKFLGVEASYRDLGNHNDTAGGSNVDADLKAYGVDVRGVLPLGKLRLFAKVGYADIRSKGSFSTGGFSSSFDDSDWKRVYGAGAEWYFVDHIGVRAEWEKFDRSSDLSSISAGVLFKF